MKTVNNISKYIVTWIEMVPVNGGIVTKHDRRIFGEVLLRGTDYKFRKHFPNKAKALEWIESFSDKLDKRYSCRLFTDAQFGMAVKNEIPFTQKQLKEVYYIG